MGYEIPFDSRANGIGNGYAAARWHGTSEADRVEPVMPKQRADETLCPADRRREVASILANGLVRWHRTTRTAGHLDAQESSPRRKTGLELFRETRLSVVNGTRGLWLRDDGDDA